MVRIGVTVVVLVFLEISCVSSGTFQWGAQNGWTIPPDSEFIHPDGGDLLMVTASRAQSPNAYISWMYTDEMGEDGIIFRARIETYYISPIILSMRFMNIDSTTGVGDAVQVECFITGGSCTLLAKDQTFSGQRGFTLAPLLSDDSDGDNSFLVGLEYNTTATPAIFTIYWYRSVNAVAADDITFDMSSKMAAFFYWSDTITSPSYPITSKGSGYFDFELPTTPSAGDDDDDDDDDGAPLLFKGVGLLTMVAINNLI